MKNLGFHTHVYTVQNPYHPEPINCFHSSGTHEFLSAQTNFFVCGLEEELWTSRQQKFRGGSGSSI